MRRRRRRDDDQDGRSSLFAHGEIMGNGMGDSVAGSGNGDGAARRDNVFRMGYNSGCPPPPEGLYRDEDAQV